MPNKSSIKTYIPDSFYHVYSRGVGKRRIFKQTSDYKVFLSYLKSALSPPITEILLQQGVSINEIKRQPKNFFSEIDLHCYVLMPNHFHLLIHQNKANSLEDFTRSILTRYSMYFNKKYNRVGHLFQGRYKAKRIDGDEYLLHLSRYIHKNPQKYSKSLRSAYSSFPEYLNLRNTSWIKTEKILSYFNKSLVKEFTKTESYANFVEGSEHDSKSELGELILESSSD